MNARARRTHTDLDETTSLAREENDAAWLLILADATRVGAVAPANDAVDVLTEDAVLSDDAEYLARCSAARDAWIERMEQDAMNEQSEQEREAP